MTTKPHHDYASIAKDAAHVRETAAADLHDKSFATHVNQGELATFAANIAALEQGIGARTTKLVAQVAAGVHVAKVRAAIAEACRSIHAAADLAFEKDEPMRRAFGLGLLLDESSTPSIELYAHTLLASAKDHPKEAAKVHLDTKGVHHLEDMLHALEGVDIAHAEAKALRHTASTHLDSLAHVVSAEAAHIRFVAKRVFRAPEDQARLARYATTLPRHEVKHRTRLAPAAPTAAPA